MRKLVRLICALALLAFGQSSYAQVTIELNSTINGATPSGTAPWLTATFADGADVNDVMLTLTLADDFGTQFITSLLFNTTIADAGDLAFTRIDTTPDSPLSSTPVTSLTGVGDSDVKGGLFDIRIAFATTNSGGGVSRFTTLTDPVIFNIESSGGNIDPLDFFAQSIDDNNGQFGSGGWYMAAKVQGIPGGLSGSVGFIPEPEIYAMLLAGLGLMGFVANRRRHVGAVG